jgi:glycosyltransferase involved in cell wall biosynthesis
LEAPLLDLQVRTFRSARIALSAARFCRWIRTNQVQIVHALDPTVIFAAPLARFMRVPVILSSVLSNRELLDTRTRAQVRWADRFLDGALVNCEALREHLVRDYQFADHGVHLWRNGVNTDQFYADARTRNQSQLRIGAVSVLRPEKQLDLLLEAFAGLRKRCPLQPVSLVIVGSGP